jgi:hypothetical protein
MVTAIGEASTVTSNSQTFDLGPPTTTDAVVASGQTIALPLGYYSSIDLLGTATGGSPTSGTFTVNYVGGGTSTFTQYFSDWQHGYNGTLGSTAPGESIALAMASYYNSSGQVNQNVDLYSYVFSTKTTAAVASITLPTNASIKILAIDVVAQAVPSDLAKADTTTEGNWIGAYGSQGYEIVSGQTSLPSYATVTPVGTTTYTWSTTATSTPALQTPGSSNRVAA